MCHVTSSGTSRHTFVPLAPLISSAASFKSPMMAQAFGFTDPSTKEMAAEILGPMDPGNFWPVFLAFKYFGVTAFISRPSGLPLSLIHI